MESRQAQPAAHFVGSPCMRGPTCPYLRRRCCFFFHPEDETASASGVGQDLPSFASLMVRIARLELEMARFIGVPVPQIMEDLVDGVQTPPQEPNQKCRDSADAAHRQGYYDGYGDTVTGLSAVAKPGDQARRDSAHGVHQQDCRDAGQDTAAGPFAQSGDQAGRDSADSVHQQGSPSARGFVAAGLPNGVEDRGSPPVAVHRQSRAAGDRSDQPDDQECRNSADSALPASVDAATAPFYDAKRPWKSRGLSSSTVLCRRRQARQPRTSRFS